MEQDIYKQLVIKYFIYIFSIFSIFIFIICVAFYIIDPLQFFHRSWFHNENLLSSNMREQVPGIINNYDYDSAILGSSMLENTSSYEAGSKLGGKFINISLRASDFYERSFVLKKLLKNNIKTVIYSMDHYYLYLSKGNPSYNTSNWISLYSNNPLRYFLYYMTKQNFINLFKKDVGLTKTNLDTPFAWMFQPQTTKRFGGLDKWIDDISCFELQDLLVKSVLDIADTYDLGNYKEIHDFKNELNVYKYLDEYILRFVSDHKNTEFHLVFPPYYRLTYAKWLKFEPKLFFCYLNSIRYLVGKAKNTPNLHIYGFENEKFLDNIDNYTDPYHYHPKYNSYMLDSIVDGKELTEKNVDEYLKHIEKKASDFDLKNFVDVVRCKIAKKS